MDAIVMLKDDHKELERLFKKLSKDDLSVVPAICSTLTLHITVEEQVFFPEINKRADVEADDIAEVLQEHHLLKVLISEIRELQPDDIDYKAKAGVLSELARHHHEEEEEDLFPEVREQLGRKRLQEIGAKMEQFKADLAKG
ncbi:MAG: hemerythrin domain-containing protein [Actinomycetota bacterium]|nr:hemerythrin domain-containing protein [Actinomycetota bacterium]